MNQYWTYQVIPQIYNMEGTVSAAYLSSTNNKIALAPRLEQRNPRYVLRVGDIIELCECQGEMVKGYAAVLARARLLTLPAPLAMPKSQAQFWLGQAIDKQDKIRMWMEVLEVYPRRIDRSELLADPVLKNSPFARVYQGTMAPMRLDEVKALNALVERARNEFANKRKP